MKVWAHSEKDFWLVLILVIQLFLYLVGALAWEYFAFSTKVTWILLSVFLMATNYQCVAHNFIHNPFFAFKSLNFAFSILNTLGVGMPQSLYFYHHMNHHRYNNDEIDPATGTTQDFSSSFRNGKNGEQENILSYSFMGLIRTPIDLFYKQALNQNKSLLVHAEIFILLMFWGLILYLNPLFFFQGVILVWVLGQVSAFAENYLEHYKTRPINRDQDSVSCYNPFYNWIWFNNGYHQEHHYRPQVHWTEIAKVKSELSGRHRTLKYAHWINL